MFVLEGGRRDRAGDGGRGSPVVYSASDLAAAARCEYALLRAFDARLGRGPAVSADDALLARTAALGFEHEQRELTALRAMVGEATVAVIGRPAHTLAGLTAAADATRDAVERRAPAIYQAAMFDGRFLGFADFLILDEDGRYRLRDTKLARSAKVEALLQLAAYVDALRGAGVPVANEVEVVLGDGSVSTHRADELVAVYLPRRDALQRLLDGHLAGDRPVSWDDPEVRACMRCEECTEMVRAHDDLLLVANARITQRARLHEAGITTMHALAEHPADVPVPGVSRRSLDVLRGQARLQVADRIIDNGRARPPYEVIDPQPLATLPEPDKGDLFFDFEGDPLWTGDGRDWGLEYLWGVLSANDGFTPIWAHDRAGELRALKQFLAMVRKRRAKHPNMHVYHYGVYEKTKLLTLAGRYGDGEDEVDDMLRAGMLVDLLPLVRKSIRVGTGSYGIKYLEPLYMGDELRDGEVTTAAGSITQYAHYQELRDDGRADDAQKVLDDIAAYNRYDCRSTKRLRAWLLNRAFEAGVPPRGPRPVVTDTAPVDPGDELERRLLAFAGEPGGAAGGRTDEQTAVALYAGARGYHAREEKPIWWAHFDRINNPVDEWSGDGDVFVAEHAEVVADWHVPDNARKPQRHVRLTGELGGGALARNMFALYDPPVPPVLGEDPDRRVSGRVTVVDSNDADAPTEVTVCEKQDPSTVFDRLPFALTPQGPLSADAAKASIEATVAAVGEELPALPDDAITDVLRRRAPRLAGGGSLPHGGAVADDLTSALLGLNHSYVAVHGPPGTGKTYTAARVITRLVAQHGWRVGVVAQSHAVVDNLLAGIVGAGADPERVGKKKAPRDAPFQNIAENAYPSFIDGPGGCVIGGTSWDFANARRVARGSLDLLVVEEAGQFNLANTIAVAPAARNLLLLGDPKQLGQVSKGTHPEPVDRSALGWLVDRQATLPAERGYFLETSHRMHPAVCAPVSALCYDGRLRALDEVTAARTLDGESPGVRLLEVDHDGNATDSPEEADAIVAAIRGLLGRRWSDGSTSGPLGQDGVLVVAPYNAQVVTLRRRLDAAGLNRVLVGTVDKFQGREAPVVFYSMTASTGADVPRGISFLLDRNRLNVAISRAKYLAVIVRSPLLTDYLPATPAGLSELGAFLTLEGRRPGVRSS